MSLMRTCVKTARCPLVRRMPLRRFFLNDADLRPAGFAVDDRDDPRVGDKRRAREDLAAVFFDDQHLVER